MPAVKATARYVGLEAGLPGPDEAVHVVDGSFVADLVLRDRDPLATPVVELIGLRIVGDIDLSFQEWRGSLSLVGCRIEGDLNLAHAHVRGRVCVTGSEVRRFDFSQSVIEGEVLFNDQSLASEGLYGLGAELTGSLDLSGARIAAPDDDPKRNAIELFRAKLADLFLIGATIDGGVYANGIRVERNVRLQRATVASRAAAGKPTDADHLGTTAVSLTSAVVGGAIYLCEGERTAATLRGELVLTRATCASFYVRPEGVADVPIALDGFAYQRLVEIEPEEWLDLVKRLQPKSNQPYIYFASHCQSYGLTRLRRRTLIAMQDQAATDPRRGRLDRLMWRGWKIAVGYGYAPARAIFWLVVAAVLSTLVLVAESHFLIDDNDVRGLHTAGALVAYGLDSGLPFASLHETDNWTADPVTTGQYIAMGSFVLLKFLGWGLAALGLASLTGIAKRE